MPRGIQTRIANASRGTEPAEYCSAAQSPPSSSEQGDETGPAMRHRAGHRAVPAAQQNTEVQVDVRCICTRHCERASFAPTSPWQCTHLRHVRCGYRRKAGQPPPAFLLTKMSRHCAPRTQFSQNREGPATPVAACHDQSKIPSIIQRLADRFAPTEALAFRGTGSSKSK